MLKPEGANPISASSLDQQQLVGLARRARGATTSRATSSAHVDKGNGIIRPRSIARRPQQRLVDDAPRHSLRPTCSAHPPLVPRPRDQAPHPRLRPARRKNSTARPLVLIDSLAPGGRPEDGTSGIPRPRRARPAHGNASRWPSASAGNTRTRPRPGSEPSSVSAIKSLDPPPRGARGHASRQLGHRVRPAFSASGVRTSGYRRRATNPTGHQNALSELVAPDIITFRGHRGVLARLRCLS